MSMIQTAKHGQIFATLSQLVFGKETLGYNCRHNSAAKIASIYFSYC